MIPDLGEVATRLAGERLAIFGLAPVAPSDDLPATARTLVLAGPDEPGFWDHATAAPEFSDGAPDPLDRWSRRVLTAIAADLGAAAVFPFGGPPWRPFVAWALRSGRARVSPVGLLVHDRAGLMVSYRGALVLPWSVAPGPPAPDPCQGCPAPCRSACPVDALAGGGYDLGACHGFLDTAAGTDCMSGGCRVRRVCPVSRRYGRQAAQSAFHMRAFHP